MFVAAAIIAGGLAAAGCAADPSQLDVQTSQEWQERVVAIAESAEAGDHATALEELAALETDATEARQDGEISAERAAIIQQSIGVVRADLEAAATVPAPEDTVVEEDPATVPSDDGSTDDEDKSDKGKDDDKKDNSGKGNKEDKGKGDDD